jgi:hypothetical protein
MNILKLISEMMVSLPLFAFASTGVAHDVDHISLAGYGQHEIKICYQKKTKEVKASQLQSFLAKGATLGECKKPKKDDKEEKEDKKEDKKDDKKVETKKN